MPRRWIAACLVAAGLASAVPAQASAQERLLETMKMGLPPDPPRTRGGPYGDTTSTTVFRAGQTYRLVISGVLLSTYDDGGFARHDAVYCVQQSSPDAPCSHTDALPYPHFQAPGEDVINRYFWDLNNPPSFEALGAAPAYREDHRYEVTYTPQRTGRLTGRSTHIFTNEVRYSGGYTVEIYGTPAPTNCQAGISRTQRVLANRGVKFTVSCPVQATVVGAVRLAGKAVGHVSGSAPAGGAIALKVKLKRATRALIRSRLRAGRRVVLKLTVAAIDVNSGATLGVVTVKVRVQ
jgi:hypothetical protein